VVNKSKNVDMSTLDAEDKRILAIIERKPYKSYSQPDLLPFTNDSLTKRMEMSKALESRLERLVDLGLIKEKTLYFSPKAKI